MEEKGKWLLTQQFLSVSWKMNSNTPRTQELSSSLPEVQAGQVCLHLLWEEEAKDNLMMHPLKDCISPPPYSLLLNTILLEG